MSLPSRTSLRTRLTVWYVGVLAAILVLYIGAVFTFQYALLKRQMYHDEVQDMVTVEGLFFFDTSGQLHLNEDYFSRPRSRLLVDRLMEVRDASGAVLYRSATLRGRELGGQPFSGEGGETFDERTVRLSDGDNVYLISHTHPIQGRQVLIRLGYSLAPLSSRMLRFLLLLICTLPLALIAAAVAGYGIARRALYPLDVMAARAESITVSNLNDRLLVPPGDDELGHMARVLNHLFERLERAFAEMKRFTADAAHELRTPLANQRVLGEIAIREKTDEEGYREAIGDMLEEAVRLSQTIDSLMILSKTETQQTGGTLTSFRLSEVVDEVTHLLDVLLEERHISVVQRTGSRDRPQITTNRDFIRLAVMNVLHNAVKFSPPGEVIEVAYETVMLEATVAERLSVKDAGPGIQQGEHEDVFKRFYTSRAPEAKPKTGTGLGLSIAKLSVERSGGRIWFDTQEISGARCCIDIPVDQSRPGLAGDVS